jgi:hypothetical protein
MIDFVGHLFGVSEQCVAVAIGGDGGLVMIRLSV